MSPGFTLYYYGQQGKKASAFSMLLEYLGLKPAPCITYSSFLIASTFSTPVFPQASMHSFKVGYIMLVTFFLVFRFSGIGLLQIPFKNPCPREQKKNEKSDRPPWGREGGPRAGVAGKRAWLVCAPHKRRICWVCSACCVDKTGIKA